MTRNHMLLHRHLLIVLLLFLCKIKLQVFLKRLLSISLVISHFDSLFMSIFLNNIRLLYMEITTTYIFIFYRLKSRRYNSR
jgi:hypothetical protein